MADIVGLRTAPIAKELTAIYLIEPPGWTRLEPQSVSGEPLPGIEARLHDPLWMLGRQWQLGELQAEDAGTPVAVHVEWETRRIDTWAPRDAGDARRVGGADLLEPLVEREPAVERTPGVPFGPGRRALAGAGSRFLWMLDDAGVGVDRTRLLADCGLAKADVDPLSEAPLLDVAGPAIERVLVGRVVDGGLLATALDAALATNPPTGPAWLTGNVDGFATVARAWLAWYRGSVAPDASTTDDTWVADRLEHTFRLRLSGAEPIGLRAPAFGGGRVDWHAFDAVDQVPDASAAPPPTEDRRRTMQATPLRFSGMAADRYWEFEDGRVSLGDLEAERFQLARLTLIEFATVFGNDWLVVPIDVPFGSFTRVGKVSYTTTFGETFDVPQADDRSRSGRFRLFETSIAGSDQTIDGLFVPPAAPAVMEGPALEEVLFLRDEMANMAWAVERTVQAPSGRGRARATEPRPDPFEPGTEQAELDYLLETAVPKEWIPILPVHVAAADGEPPNPNAIVLRKGAMVDIRTGQAVEPLGQLLHPIPLDIQDEEVPREGVRVRRVPVLARRPDGTYARWIARRVSVGRGEGASGLAFDSAVPRKPSTP
ncbi:MAG TPA: hypothetical protein VH440_06590 [Candidatus Limnocylindrales bacterium]